MAFIWSLIVQHPTVLVGVRPPGLISDVYIAPQGSAKRKAKSKGEELVEPSTPTLDLIDDAKERTLQTLSAAYGKNLRIAVEPDAVFAAITGSHIRVSASSPPRLLFSSSHSHPNSVQWCIQLCNSSLEDETKA